MKALRFVLIALVGIVFSLSSCDESRVFEKNREIKDYIWDSRNKASFTFEVKDTTTLHNIYVNVRHADFYQFSNIWLMVRTTFPDGKQLSKRVEVPLANDDGAWYGEGLGDIWDAQHLIQQGAFFEQPGKYTFDLEHNMRKDPLPGIMAIGLRVENTGIRKQ